MEMDLWLEKANVLIEALPYIQKYNGKVIVVKYGGSAMVDEELKKHVIQDVALLKLVGFKPIIVHGGGKEISKWVKKSGMTPQFINGLRVTDEDTMEVAEKFDCQLPAYSFTVIRIKKANEKSSQHNEKSSQHK